MKTFFKIILFVPVLIALFVFAVTGLFVMWYDVKFKPKGKGDAI